MDICGSSIINNSHPVLPRSVTAGVLRGDRNRFQLFGGTVNRAGKIEAEAEPGRIVISSKWMRQREISSAAS